MNLYFAYGSNMDQDQMRERCPSAAVIGHAMLLNHRLAFTIFSPKRQCGCADVVPSPGDTVCGVLYHLTDADMAVLDEFEGHPVYYRRTLVSVQCGGEEIEACIYEVVDKKETLPPSAHYLGLLQNAAAHFDFPEEYQSFLKGIQTL